MKEKPSTSPAPPLEGYEDWQSLYSDIFDAVQDGLSLIDAELSGHAREEIAGKHFSKLPTLVAKEIPRYVKMFLSLLSGKIPPIIPFQYITKSGQHRWAEARVSRVEVEGKTLGLLGQLRDVTDRLEKARDWDCPRYTVSLNSPRASSGWIAEWAGERPSISCFPWPGRKAPARKLRRKKRR